ALVGERLRLLLHEVVHSPPLLDHDQPRVLARSLRCSQEAQRLIRGAGDREERQEGERELHRLGLKSLRMVTTLSSGSAGAEWPSLPVMSVAMQSAFTMASSVASIT